MQGWSASELSGAVALSGLAYGLTHCILPLITHCDNQTFRARLSKNAFREKVVWITGASSGLGRELARQLSRQGAKLIISSRRADVLEEVKQECLAINPETQVHVLVVDLEDLDSLDGKAKQALAFFGNKIDVLINNGGVSTRSSARDAAYDVTMKLTKVDFLSCVKLAKAVLPSMTECVQDSPDSPSVPRGGHIVNISSVAGKAGAVLRTAYCGAKFALIGWFDALRVEEHVFGSGVRVTNVCPGSVQTNVARNAVMENADSSFGQSDPNIEGGLSVEFACERILAGVQNGVDEVWIAGPLEMFFVYASQYAPTFAKWLAKRTGKKMMQSALAEDKKVE